MATNQQGQGPPVPDLSAQEVLNNQLKEQVIKQQNAINLVIEKLESLTLAINDRPMEGVEATKPTS